MKQYVKNPNKVIAGKKSRALGSQFELRVRKDLIEKGWIVDKWSNNVEFIKEIDEIKSRKMANHYLQGQVDYLNSVIKDAFRGKLIPAKSKWAGPGRPMMMGAGFPDFIAFECIRPYKSKNIYHNVIGVESKMNGTLDKEEKQKCQWLLDNHIFSKILIASKHKIKNRIHIEYNEYKRHPGNECRNSK